MTMSTAASIVVPRFLQPQEMTQGFRLVWHEWMENNLLSGLLTSKRMQDEPIMRSCVKQLHCKHAPRNLIVPTRHQRCTLCEATEDPISPQHGNILNRYTPPQ